MKTKFYFLLITVCSFANNFLFAEGEESSAPPIDQSFWQTLVMIGIALMFFYFILWRPEQKKRQAMEMQREALKKGDRVVVMGMIGTVSKINDQTQTVIIKMVEGAKIEFFKSAISDILPEEEGNKKVELITEDRP